MGECDIYLEFCLSKDTIGPTQVRINHPPSSFPYGYEKKIWKVRKIFHQKELKTMFWHQMKLNMDLRGAQIDHKGFKTVFLSFFTLTPSPLDSTSEQYQISTVAYSCRNGFQQFEMLIYIFQAVGFHWSLGSHLNILST